MLITTDNVQLVIKHKMFRPDIYIPSWLTGRKKTQGPSFLQNGQFCGQDEGRLVFGRAYTLPHSCSCRVAPWGHCCCSCFSTEGLVYFAACSFNSSAEQSQRQFPQSHLLRPADAKDRPSNSLRESPAPLSLFTQRLGCHGRASASSLERAVEIADAYRRVSRREPRTD